MTALANFAATIEFTPSSFEGLSRHFDAQWLEKALAVTAGAGEVKVRKRKLPREVALWLPIGMGLFRDRSIHEVIEHLDLVVDEHAGSGISAGAIPRARARVGSAPLVALFDLSADSWSRLYLDANRWRDLTLWAMDGTCLNLPDTEENAKAFGRADGRSPSAFPQARVAALLNARTHILAGLCVGPYDQGELTLLEPLWDRIPDYSMTLVDRGLHSWWAFDRLSSRGTERHWMTRSRANLSAKLVKKLGRGDDLVEVTVSAKARKKHPDAPEKLLMRRVRVMRKGYQPMLLLTSALDPERYPASELRDVYAQRWEIELGYDEIKNHLLEGEVTLRSKTADGVKQEVFGIGIAYNLVRLELARVASELRVTPTRMSFRHAVGFIRGFMLSIWATSPGAIPKRLGSLDRQVRLLLLPPRRARHCPRVVRRRDARYPVRRPAPSAAK
jgi:hypothetical protein